MKLIKRIFTGFLVSLFVVTSVPMNGVVGLTLPGVNKLFSIKASAATKYMSGYYTYTVSNNEVTIIDVDESICGNIVIPSELGGYPVKKIGDWAFAHCYEITSVTIQNPVTDIGDSAFYCCKNISKINLPESLITIEDFAFENCNLEEIFIPKNVIKIGILVFGANDYLKNIIVDGRNEYFSSENGILFNKDKTILIQYPPERNNNSYYVPETVKTIGRDAFSFSWWLEEIIIPDNVENIGDFSFHYCFNLKKVILSKKLKSIPSNAFGECENLTTINIPSIVESIGGGAFSNCTKLESISIPNSVTSIGDSAFFRCTNISDVYYSGTAQQWNTIKISGIENENLINAKKFHFNSTLYLETNSKNQNLIDEHLTFAYGFDYKSLFRNANFAYNMSSLKNTTEYNWDKIISLNFDNYYKVVLTDLILKQNTKEKLDDIALNYAGKEYVETVDKISGWIIDLVNEYDNKHEFTGKIKKDEITKLIEGDADTDSTVYKLLSNFFKNNPKAEATLKKSMIAYDRIGQLSNFIETGVEIVNIIRQTASYIASVNAYVDLENDFKEMFSFSTGLVSTDKKYKKLAEAMTAYVNSDSKVGGYAKEVYDAVSKGGLEIVYNVFKCIYEKATLSKLGVLCSKVVLPGGATLGATLSTTAGNITMQVANGVLTGVSLGVGISQFITGASSLSKEMCMVTAVGDLSYYINIAMTTYEDALKNNPTYKNAKLFDSAYCFYKDIQIYAFDHTISALQEKNQSIVQTFFKKKVEDTNTLIKDLKNDRGKIVYINCHKMSVYSLDYDIKSSYIYDGSKITPSISIEGRKLGEDYIVEYSDNNAVGIAKVKIIGKAPYFKDTVTKTYTINPGQVKNLKISGVSASSISLKWDAVKGCDTYEISYLNTKTAVPGSAGTVKTVKGTSYTLDKLTKDSLYECSIRAIKTVNGKKYTGKQSSKVSALTSGKVTVSLSSTTMTYTGNAFKPTVTVKDASGNNIDKSNYTLTYTNNVNTGTATVKVILKGNYYGTVSKNFTIKPKSISSKNTKLTISATSYTYDGKAKKPTVTVKDSKGKVIDSKYYTVKYTNNTNVGKATVTVTFKGNYSGTLKATFNINPKGTTLSSVTAKSKGFTAKWNKQATQTTGYQVQYSTSSKFTDKTTKTTIVKDAKTLSKTISSLKGNTKYYVRVRTYKTASKVNYYSAWSAAKTVTTKK